MADLISMLAAASGIGAEEADPNFKQTVLLLHGDGTNGAQNNTFLDSSTNNFTITRNGNTTQGTFSPFSLAAGEWSNYFDGDGDTLTVADNSAFAMGTGDFTVEFWAYSTDSASNQRGIFDNRANNSSSSGLFFRNESTGSFIFGVGNTSVLTVTGRVNNTWQHIAIVRSSGTVAIYINGVSAGTAASTTNFTDQKCRISGFVDAQASPFAYLGYLSNFRIVKGTAVYTSAFTPSTTPLTNITNTSLLTCQSNRFVDNSTNAFAITRNGDVRVTPFSPFAPTAAYSAGTNGGSVYVDGNGDYLSVADNAAFNFGTGNFTLEFWIYTQDQTTSYPAILSCSSYNTTGAINIRYDNTGQANKVFVYLFGASPSDPLLTSSTYAFGQWLHVVLVRDSTTTMKLYVNGVQDGSATISSGQTCDLRAGGETRVGRGFDIDGSNGYFAGYISGVKVIKGTAVAPSGIPTTPPVDSSGTSLLCNFTNAGIIDNTGKNNLETVGNAQIDTTTKKYGTGSLEFDGNGDWLLMPNTPDQQLGTGNFTIEFWVYLATGDTGSARGLVAKGTSTTGWLVSLDSSQKVVFTYTTSTITSSGAITTNAWNHIAVVRSGTGSNQTKIYIGGTNDGTGTVSTDFNQTSVMYVGANRTGGDAMKGFIDDLRITKGVARYTANFTPPTAAFPNE